jgi:TolB-like protein/Tfp pilus assembly protein PilF
MSDVFLSYKAEDRRRVEPLVAALEADGLSVWWDVQIGGGSAWREAIEAQLDRAKCILVVWSKRSVGQGGSFVRDEASRAMDRDIYLPVKLDSSRPPLGFGETQAIPLSGWRGDRSDKQYQAILDAVRSILEHKPRLSHGTANGEPRISRRAALAGGGFVVAAAAGGAGWLLLKSGAGAASKTIAVMPFANLSGDPAQAYFSDGLAEELRNALSRIAELHVVARTSSEAVRDEDVKTAAHKLGVTNILAGSVRRSPSTIRVNAQLVDGNTGLERWSESFDRPIGDSLAIQTNIAESVANALSIQLGEAAKAALTLGGTNNVEAHDLLLKADPARADDTKEGMERSLSLIDAAIALDPNYALAYARKAVVLNGYTGFYAATLAENEAGLARAEAAARRAIALAPRLAGSHAALALVFRNEARFKPAFSEMQRAVDLGGNDAATQRNYAIFLSQIGRPNDAWKAAVRGAALDPLSPGAFGSQGNVLFAAHQFAAAAAKARQSLELAPARSATRTLLGSALLMQGRIREAEVEFRKLPPRDVHALMGLAVIAALTGDRHQSDAIISKIRQAFGDNASYQYAQIYAQRREGDLAIAMLRKAIEVRDPGLAGTKVDPYLDPIRGDPRLTGIIRELDFPS